MVYANPILWHAQDLRVLGQVHNQDTDVWDKNIFFQKLMDLDKFNVNNLLYSLRANLQNANDFEQ